MLAGVLEPSNSPRQGAAVRGKGIRVHLPVLDLISVDADNSSDALLLM